MKHSDTQKKFELWTACLVVHWLLKLSDLDLSLIGKAVAHMASPLLRINFCRLGSQYAYLDLSIAIRYSYDTIAPCFLILNKREEAVPLHRGKSKRERMGTPFPCPLFLPSIVPRPQRSPFPVGTLVLRPERCLLFVGTQLKFFWITTGIQFDFYQNNDLIKNIGAHCKITRGP